MMADRIFLPGQRDRPLTTPAGKEVTPQQAAIALFALELTRSVGACDPYFPDHDAEGARRCFFCGKLASEPHDKRCGHVTAKRLIDSGDLEG